MSIFSVNGVGKVKNPKNSTKLGWKKIISESKHKKTRDHDHDDDDWDTDDNRDVVFNSHKFLHTVNDYDWDWDK